MGQPAANGAPANEIIGLGPEARFCRPQYCKNLHLKMILGNLGSAAIEAL
jgi:hypothetical protein